MLENRESSYQRTLVIVFVCIGGLLYGLQQAISQQIVDKQDQAALDEASSQATAGWEYKNAKIDAATLQETLNEWGANGWEVFSVIPLIGAAQESTSAIKPISVQVTAKRISRIR